jgi:hypothetical protein
MPRYRFGTWLARSIAALLVGACAGFRRPATRDARLLAVGAGNSLMTPEANLYRTSGPPRSSCRGCGTQPPSKIIAAWRLCLDSNRGDLILWGRLRQLPRNDVYRWHSLVSGAASLSEIKTDLLDKIAIDGVDNADLSHTYDNNLFLPVADRFNTLGAAWGNGGPSSGRWSRTRPFRRA